MNDVMKMIVWLLKQMLQREKPLLNNPRKVEIFYDDGVRRVEILWTPQAGTKIRGLKDGDL